MDDILHFHESRLIMPECIVCHTSYATKIYGGELEFCPRCKTEGVNFMKQLEILATQYEQSKNKVLENWRRKIAPQELTEV